VTKSEDTATLIAGSPLTGEQAACEEAAVLPGSRNLCLETESKVPLVPEPLSCSGGSVCCPLAPLGQRWILHSISVSGWFFQCGQRKGK